MKQTALTVIHNPFDKRKRVVRQIMPGMTVKETLEHFSVPVDPEKVIVTLDGKRVEDYSLVVESGRSLTVCPRIEGGGGNGGKNILGVIAGIALSVMSMGVASWANVAWFGAAKGAALTIGAMMVGMAVMTLGGLLIQSLFPMATPDLKFADPSQSQTYGWGRQKALQGQGQSIPVTFGTVRTAGQLLAYHVSTDGDNQYLNVLLSGGEGPLDEISDIRIDGNPHTNYDGVQIETRLGTNDQAVMSHFSDTPADQALSFELAVGSPRTQQTEGNAGQGLEITLEFPGGLYYANDQGGLDAASVTVKAEYRLVGGSWVDWGTWTITEAKSSGFYRTYRIDGLSAGQYEVRVTCLSKSGTSSRHSTKVYWIQLTHWVYDDFILPNIAQVAIRALATSQLSGSLPDITWQQSRHNVWVWNPDTSQYVQKPAYYPAWASYDLIHSVRRLNDVRTGQWVFVVDSMAKERMDYQGFNEWAAMNVAKNLQFHHIFDTAYAFWDALKLPEAVGRGKVLRFGTTYRPIWDAAKTMTQMFTVGNIARGSFKQKYLPFKDRANAVEITFFDKDRNYERRTITVTGSNYKNEVPNHAQLTLWGVVTLDQAWREGKYRLALGMLKRTVVFRAGVDAINCSVGDRIDVQHDVPEWGEGGRLVSATPTTLKLDRAVTLIPGKTYEVLIRYSNAVDYVDGVPQDRFRWAYVAAVAEQTTTDELPLSAALDSAPSPYDLYSFGEENIVVKPFTVLKISRSADQDRELTCLEYNEAIYTEASDVPVIDYRVQSIKAMSVAVTEIYPRSGAGLAKLSITWSGAANSRAYETQVWVGRTVSTLRRVALLGYGDDPSCIVDVDASGEWTAKVVAVDIAGSTIAQGTTSITIDTTLPGNVSNITLEENTFLLKDGTALSDLLVTFVAPENPVGLIYQAYYELDSSGAWTYFGQAMPAGFTIKALKNAASVKVKIVSVNANTLLSSTGLTSVSYTITGKSAPPSDVTGFTAVQRTTDRSIIDLKWTGITDIDLNCYELRYGESWAAGTVVAKQIGATAYQFTAPQSAYYRFMVCALDNSGNYSASPAIVGLRVTLTPDAPTNLAAAQLATDLSVLSISFDRVSGGDIAGYEIRTGASWASSTLIAFVTANKHDWRLNASGTYPLLVKAKTVAGYYSVNPASLSVTVTIEPMDVTGFTATQSINDRTKVTLYWDAPTQKAVSHYIIKKGAAWETAAVVGNRVTGVFCEVSVTEETAQIFLIKAVSVDGKESQYPAQVTDIYSLNPAPVTNIVLAQSATDKSVMNISFDGIMESDLAYYDIRLGYVWESATQIGKTKEMKWTHPLSGTGSVKIMIKSISAAGYESDEASATLYATMEPLAVTGFAAYQNGETVQLYWDKSSEFDVVAYEIREGATFAQGALVASGVTLNQYVVSIDAERQYRYHIKAINRAGYYSDAAASVSVVAANLPVRNIIATYDEIESPTGTHSNTEFGESLINFSNMGGRFSDYPTTRFSDVGGAMVLKLTNVAGVYALSGTYTTAAIDIGQIITANLTARFVSTVLLTGSGSAILQVRTSQDGTNYTDWVEFKPVQYTFRYAQFRVLLATTDPAKTPEVNQITINIDVPDTEIRKTVTVAAGGSTIAYGHNYYAQVVLTPTAIGEGLRAELISKTLSGCVLKVKNASNTDVGGQVDLRGRGY